MEDQGTTLWSLSKNGCDMTCRVRLVTYGIEIDIMRDGSTLVTRTFETDDAALAWADQKRRQREAEGWTANDP
jgi:hypothetical protein